MANGIRPGQILLGAGVVVGGILLYNFARARMTPATPQIPPPGVRRRIVIGVNSNGPTLANIGDRIVLDPSLASADPGSVEFEATPPTMIREVPGIVPAGMEQDIVGNGIALMEWTVNGGELRGVQIVVGQPASVPAMTSGPLTTRYRQQAAMQPRAGYAGSYGYGGYGNGGYGGYG